MELYNKILRKNSKYIKEVKQLYKNNNIKLIIKQDINKPIIAYANCEASEVILFLDKIKNIKRFLEVCYHEFSHIICYRNNKYINYHTLGNKYITKISTKQLKSCLYTSLKAERYVDNLAKIIIENDYPNIEYEGSYNDSIGIRNHRYLITNTIRNELKRRHGRINKKCQK